MDHELIATLSQRIDDLNDLLEQLISVFSDVYR